MNVFICSFEASAGRKASLGFTIIERKGVCMVREEAFFKECFKCHRNFSERRFRALQLHGLKSFGDGVLELRRCVCEMLISVEHCSASMGGEQIERIIAAVQSTALAQVKNGDGLEKKLIGIPYQNPRFGKRGGDDA